MNYLYLLIFLNCYNNYMLILMGPSASGKTEVAKILEAKYNLKKVITHTTRQIRVGEKNGIDYHFVDKDTFLTMKINNEFVDTAVYNNNFYGTSKKEVADNKCVVLEPQGAESFKKLGDNHIFIAYLNCSENERIRRMHARKDAPDKILSRIESDRLAFSKKTPLIADVTVDSEKNNQNVLADILYTLYKDYLSSL